MKATADYDTAEIIKDLVWSLNEMILACVKDARVGEDGYYMSDCVLNAGKFWLAERNIALAPPDARSPSETP